MGLFSKAKDNYDKRRDIAEFNYKAREYVNDGRRVYQEAYSQLVLACSEVGQKILKFVRFKQDQLREVNRIMKSIDSNHKDLELSLKVDFPRIECHATESPEKLTMLDEILATWTEPSLMDFFGSVSDSDYYAAKNAMYDAKMYRDRMRMKRDELKNAKYAVKEIPSFIWDEESKIEALMSKFRKTAECIKSKEDKEQIDSLCQIAALIADSLTTQFVDNHYQITEQYTEVHRRMEQINQRLDCAYWLR